MENKNILEEFDSSFENNIKKSFKEYDLNALPFKQDDKSTIKRIIYAGKNKDNENDIIYVKQIKLFFETKNIIKDILKEIYFLVLLNQSENISFSELSEIEGGNKYFSKLSEIKISDDKKYIFLIFRENGIALSNFGPESLKKNTQYITFFICLELYFLHYNKIVHNDLKPSNIAHDDNSLYLLDFGAMRYEEEESTEHTEYYGAPERFYSKGGNKSDMWSLGVSMISMFSTLKKNNFLGKKEKEVLFSEINIKSEYVSSNEEENKINYEKIKEIVNDEKAFNLIKNLVVLNPDKRYSAKEALNSDYFSGQYKQILSQCEFQKLEKLNIYEQINKLKDEKDIFEIIKELDLKLKEIGKK